MCPGASTARASASPRAGPDAPGNLTATSRLHKSGDKSPHSKPPRRESSAPSAPRFPKLVCVRGERARTPARRAGARRLRRRSVEGEGSVRTEATLVGRRTFLRRERRAPGHG